MGSPSNHPVPRQAGPDLLVLEKWETFSGWLLNHTGRWPKSARFTLTQRIENHALDVVEMLVEARYAPARRRELLSDINLRLTRMRFLFRLARDARIETSKGFATSMRRLDEVGRMVHGWRIAIGARSPR